MEKTPKGLRLQIGLFGRTNVGKSSLLNYICGQDISITSTVAGTTTDVVEKAMELLPVGPVLFLDTAGLDDISELASERLRRTRGIYDRADVALLVIEPDRWTDHETAVVQECGRRGTPLIVLINKIDTGAVGPEVDLQLKRYGIDAIPACSLDPALREAFVTCFKSRLLAACPEGFLAPPPLLADLVRPGRIAVLVVPIDLEAPKGRIILPQVQAIRDALDADAAALVVKEREYRAVLQQLKEPPDIVVCDSQVVLKTMADTPESIPCTTFSILMARLKGHLGPLVEAATAIDTLKPADRVLICEACTHHAIEDDIARVKIPRWLRQYTGFPVEIDYYAGTAMPERLRDYALIIHCGGCMINRRMMLSRQASARSASVPITNYGVCISFVQGVLERALRPFAEAHTRFQERRPISALPNLERTTLGSAR